MAATAAILKRTIANLKLFKEQLAGQAALLEAFDPEVDDQYTLLQYSNALNELHRDQQVKILELFEHIPDERFSDWVAEDAAFKRIHATCMAQVNRLLARYPSGRKEEKHTPVNSIKLPDIPLPTFNGNYHEWVTFKQKFEGMVTKNASLPDEHKLHYLRMSLTDEAADIQSENDTFESLWITLIQRFEVKKIIVEKQIGELFKLPKMASESSAELRKLLDVVTKNLRVLKSLNLGLDGLSEQFIVNLVASRLDAETRKAIEGQSKAEELPKWDEMLDFLQRRCHTLEAIESSSEPKAKLKSPSPASFPFKANRSNTHVSQSNRKTISCPVCEGPHYIIQCPEFLNLTPDSRLGQAKKLQLCLNCLQSDHFLAECKKGCCRHCNQKHNSLLHLGKIDSGDSNGGPSNSAVHVSNIVNSPTKGMMSTAVVIVLGENETPIHIRALLDSASESNFITQRLLQLAKARAKPINEMVVGFGENNTPMKKMTTLKIKSRTSNFTTKLDFLITKKIAGQIPSSRVFPKQTKIPERISLADPQFDIPQPVDMLIGAEIFFDLFTNEKIELQPNLPPLRETLLGWVVAGKIDVARSKPVVTSSHYCGVSNTELQKDLKRFWEIESCETKRFLSREERLAEEDFSKNVQRQADGRYVVALPLKKSVDQLGDSRKIAKNRFAGLERRFTRQPQLKVDYTAFMDEYLSLGHMKLADSSSGEYLIPHHAVIKPESSSTKLRVVFDASAKTSVGLSLNDVLNVGPTIQQDLLEIVLRFRKYQYVFTADISKMYRQVMVREDQQKFQKILWRPTQGDELLTYQLTTVTYGTSCAPFLATRVLQQLANDEEANFPTAAKSTRTDFYVDDVLTGADNMEEALILQSELIELLRRGGFSLHKWCANDERLLEKIPAEGREKAVQLAESEAIKTLGITWQPKQDSFVVTIDRVLFSHSSITKRSILSDVARLYDPLGMVGPIILTAKILLQTLWQKRLDWDEPLNETDATMWTEFREQLRTTKMIVVPRCVIPFSQCQSIQLVGFCDGSTAAYGACVYVHCVSQEGKRSSRLLCSKSRVAPLKVITVPRLELCAAVLLSQLVAKIQQAMNIKFDKITLFTDSTIVLGWINSESSKAKTFVAHRIADIQDLTSPEMWRHVSTEQNPADVVSRGLMPNQLNDFELWWNGPAFLNQAEEQWPPNDSTEIPELPEMKEKVSTTVLVTKRTYEPILSLIEKLSQMERMQRTTAYVRRFISNAQKPKAERQHGPICAVEMLEAWKILIRAVQQQSFAKELQCIDSGEPINQKSALKSLNIFRDDDGILRVGGRLRHSKQTFDTKHQVVLPKNSHFAITVARSLHNQHGHVGQQALLAIIRQTYWPIRAKDLVKYVTRRCVRCFRCCPRTVTQPMGDLPPSRVELLYPFIDTGVDYAGPMQLKVNRRTSIKCYLAIFVCMATKAVHLEVVTDASTQAFLAALTRFISRRGHCRTIFSDNGTNFVGARSELESLYQALATEALQNEVVTYCAQQQIEFRFIPPRSPHFGGLWEAAVKSMKYHLKRIAGPVKLTFEEMSTLLTKIEAILNSRPLIPDSTDPEDASALTPGHFLIGRPLVALIEPDLSNVKPNRLDRWQILQQMSQHFWRRWSNEYLTTLQQRAKATEKINIRVGMIVLLKEDNIPPMQWALAKITELHPGFDGIVRVVTVQTWKTTLKRGVVNVCILPVQDNEDAVPVVPVP